MRVVLCWILLSLGALARVGGGQDYGGGGSSSSDHSGGSGGGGDGVGLLIELLIRLVFYYPKIGIPLVIALAVGYWWSQRQGQAGRQFNELKDWSAQNTRQGPLAVAPADLERLKADDPNFSRPLFLDFVNHLYTRASLLSGADLSPIGAYLNGAAREALEKGPGWQRVVLGAIRVVAVNLSVADQKVVVDVEANLENDEGSSLFVIDQLVFHRRPTALTPPPEAVYSFACPRCGNPSTVDASGRCSSCQNPVNNGRFGWLLTDISRQHSAPKPKLVLSESGEELGTDLPTRRDANLEQNLAQLRESDPAFSLAQLEEQARSSFLVLQKAWSDNQWELARPLESDLLFGQHQIWMEAYAKEGFRNVLADVEVERVVLARLERDHYFESATFRIFARMKDYTVRLADQAVVSGDANKIRSFSEYWTFIRRAGVTSQERKSQRCPNCGAALDRVTVAGVCEYCDANITRGDFDWVLSRIEQDEAYV